MTQTPTEKKPAADRTPIKVAVLYIVSTNTNGIRIPQAASLSDKMEHKIESGDTSFVRTEIEYRPWMRHHRIARSVKFAGPDGKDTWRPETVFYVHETHASWVPAEE